MSNYISSIEDYPHVIDKLCKLWGHPELFAYLDGLVTTERADLRTGFNPDAISEMFWLFDIHRLVCPESNGSGLWSHVSIYDDNFLR
jgi:hypothetical protein